MRLMKLATLLLAAAVAGANAPEARAAAIDLAALGLEIDPTGLSKSAVGSGFFSPTAFSASADLDAMVPGPDLTVTGTGMAPFSTFVLGPPGGGMGFGGSSIASMSGAGMAQILFTLTDPGGAVGELSAGDQVLVTISLPGSGVDPTDATFFVGPAQMSVESVRSLAPIPVPAALPLLIGGLAALGFSARRRA